MVIISVTNIIYNTDRDIVIKYGVKVCVLFCLRTIDAFNYITNAAIVQFLYHIVVVLIKHSSGYFPII